MKISVDGFQDQSIELGSLVRSYSSGSIFLVTGKGKDMYECMILKLGKGVKTNLNLGDVISLEFAAVGLFYGSVTISNF